MHVDGSELHRMALVLKHHELELSLRQMELIVRRV
jgi:hypothetical protein